MNEADELRIAFRPLLREWAERAAAEAVRSHREDLELLRESLAGRRRKEA